MGQESKTEKGSVEKLLSQDWYDAYLEGASTKLILNRNRYLGSLLNSERSLFYIQILYRMLCFRREYELEPLNEDIYNEVRLAQEALGSGEYLPENFNHDISQLTEWKIITRRIEKDRLRGYKDMSRNKFRYRLADDAIAFLQWLEERLHDDLEENVEDTRNLLFDVGVRIKEALRSLDSVDLDSQEEDENLDQARIIIYQIEQLRDMTNTINLRLGDLNAQLASFLINNYNLDEAREILKELEFYLTAYLRQIHRSRQEIIPNIEQLSTEINLWKLEICLGLLKREQKNMARLFKRTHRMDSPNLVLKGLRTFYESGGQLDNLCHRVNESSMRVLGKLSAHLRELERKSNRMEDLRTRIEELATLKEDEVPVEFILGLIAPAQMLTDSHYWDEFEKAVPPVPRKEPKRNQEEEQFFIRMKHTGRKKVRSMEESRLERLREWMVVTFPEEMKSASLGNGNYSEFEDFMKVTELVKNGILGKGKKLAKIGYSLNHTGKSGKIALDIASLEFKDMEIVQVSGEEDGQFTQ